MLHIGIYGFIFSSISSFKITSQINWWTADNFYFVLNFFNGSVNQQITIFFLRISFVTKSSKVGKTFDFSYVRSHLLGVKFHCCCFYFLIQRIITLSHLVLTFFFFEELNYCLLFLLFFFLSEDLFLPPLLLWSKGTQFRLTSLTIMLKFMISLTWIRWIFADIVDNSLL